MAKVSQCSVDGCDNTVKARGYCSWHYNKLVFAKTAGKCSVSGCEKPVRGKGYCCTHYRKYVTLKRAEQCTVTGCDKPMTLNGYCDNHNYRYKAHGDPFLGRPDNGSGLEFLKSILDTQQKSCIIYPFGKMTSGYGVIHFNGESMTAARCVCILLWGDKPGMHAAHNCGKGHLGCVNPRHLQWKTPSENAQDKLKHGTHNKGVKHGNAKLTSEQVKRIYLSKESVATLSQRYDISARHIRKIRSGKSWTHITSKL